MNIGENFPLKKYNTFGIEARAKYFARFSTLQQLEECVEFISTAALSHPPPTLILGGGSNILFTKNYDGLVLKNELTGIEKIDEDDDYVYIRAGAGESWHQLVLYCIEQNLGGVENLSLIPGSVGASPMQNIGAYGVEVKDVFHSLEAFHLHDKKMVHFTNGDCEFGYRESIFKRKYSNQFVICNVSFRLNKKPKFNTTYGAIAKELESMGVKDLNVQAISQAVINIRSSKLPNPLQVGNAGSFFKNPEVTGGQFIHLKQQFPGMVGYDLAGGNVKLAAGWLIENCGPTGGISWKGYRQGDTGCHSKQALVLVNYGNATGEEIYLLSEKIIDSVKEKFGIVLQREVNIIN